ncbi:MAG: S-adenosylmethionine:tRNA ribosyltransferase-isomerase [Alphaproteobacteria bacterium ADurb.Bin438]|nr:MAG: S-adenosylmethionine:tRNA ribosyltransferase-isomerase [Alphaproteobacteria bacterium ADurb.Bin438]
MKVDIFDFELPDDLIASEPVFPKDSSRLLDVLDDGTIKDRHFADIKNLLTKDDVLVFNNTKVIPARIEGKKKLSVFDITLFKKQSDKVWQCLIKKSKRLKVDDILAFDNNVEAKVLEKNEDGFVFLEFNVGSAEFFSFLQSFGKMPLPPYIRKGKARDDDKVSYQTVYAKNLGAVAAPTAGLHFTEELLKELPCKRVELTLHVGGGTFLPVKVDDTNDHKMHAEYGEISLEACNIINEVKKQGKGRVIAVGTTSLRLLESACDENGVLSPFAKETDIFITPGYKFKVIDAMITNFHLPKSTLIMLVSALLGIDVIKNAYSHAIKEKYRFYSYGDATFLHKNK